MKHGKKLTVREKTELKKLGYEPNCYLKTKKYVWGLEVINIVTGVVQNVYYKA